MPRGIDTSDATATASDIYYGKTAYVDGTKLRGTMSNRASWSDTIDDAQDTITIPEGWHSGSGTVTIDQVSRSRLVPSNIKKDVSILGVTGNYEGVSPESLQIKSVVPGVNAQTIRADEGYLGLSQVTVEGINCLIEANSAGGLTLTIGVGSVT